MVASTAPPAPLSARDWIVAALDVIANEGLNAVAVEPLARRLGVTKGSFYWHFPNRAALIEGALAHWERTGTEEIIGSLEEVPDPRERLGQLLASAIGHRARGRLAAALYAAADDPAVAPVLRRVTSRRLAYLEEIYAALGLPPDQARHWALHAYATYMGLHYLLRAGLADTELEDSAAQLRETLLPSRQPLPSL